MSGVWRALHISKTGRSLGEKAEEHDMSMKKHNIKSALSQHQQTSGHIVKSAPVLESIKILENEVREPHRKRLEAINIKLNGTTLNHDEGAELLELCLPLLMEEACGHNLTSMNKPN